MSELIIRCPSCGYEYMPAEIFYPDDLIGKPTEIMRDTAGRIEFHLGTDQNFDETYICDNCGAKFHVHANLNYSVKEIPDEFSEDYVTRFSKLNKVKLEENQLFD